MSSTRTPGVPARTAPSPGSIPLPGTSTTDHAPRSQRDSRSDVVGSPVERAEHRSELPRKISPDNDGRRRGPADALRPIPLKNSTGARCALGDGELLARVREDLPSSGRPDRLVHRDPLGRLPPVLRRGCEQELAFRPVRSAQTQRSSRRMRFRWANSISTFFRSRARSRIPAWSRCLAPCRGRLPRSSAGSCEPPRAGSIGI